MSLSAVRTFNADGKLTKRKTIPRHREGLFKKLLNWQLETIPLSIIARVHRWQASPEQTVPGLVKSIGKQTIQAWSEISAELERGRPVVLVLIRVRGFFGDLTKNHQVVAIGYKSYQHQQSTIHCLQIYDPNWPEETGELVFTLGPDEDRLNIHQRPRRRDQTVRGFFLNHKG